MIKAIITLDDRLLYFSMENYSNLELIRNHFCYLWAKFNNFLQNMHKILSKIEIKVRKRENDQKYKNWSETK